MDVQEVVNLVSVLMQVKVKESKRYWRGMLMETKMVTPREIEMEITVMVKVTL